jgi:hypothetical protein
MLITESLNDSKDKNLEKISQRFKGLLFKKLKEVGSFDILRITLCITEKLSKKELSHLFDSLRGHLYVRQLTGKVKASRRTTCKRRAKT